VDARPLRAWTATCTEEDWVFDDVDEITTCDPGISSGAELCPALLIGGDCDGKWPEDMSGCPEIEPDVGSACVQDGRVCAWCFDHPYLQTSHVVVRRSCAAGAWVHDKTDRCQNVPVD